MKDRKLKRYALHAAIAALLFTMGCETRTLPESEARAGAQIISVESLPARRVTGGSQTTNGGVKTVDPPSENTESGRRSDSEEKTSHARFKVFCSLCQSASLADFESSKKQIIITDPPDDLLIDLPPR